MRPRVAPLAPLRYARSSALISRRRDMKTVTLKEYRALAVDALRMIREVVEQHAPPGSVPREEMVEPRFVKEAEVLVRGILAIAEAR